MQKTILFIALIYSLFSFKHKTVKDSRDKNHFANPLEIKWQNIIPGLDFCETMAPRKSKINDSKITILKLNPEFFDFHLMMATEHNVNPLNAKEWADSFDLDIVLNAGMYDLNNHIRSKGFLKNEKHTNNTERLPNYNSVIAFKPKNKLDKRFTICDLECDSFSTVQKRFHCLAQGLRMLDCNSEPIAWNKRKQYCSQLITTIDDLGNVYLIFVRSPYLHNEMISYMKQMKLNLYNAIYMEGGPQTSLYVDIKKDGKQLFHLEKIGSYVSDTYPNDNNNHYWKLPNVIGMKLKKEQH